MTQKPRKSDFGELKKKKKIHGVHASDPPRSLRLRRSFWKTVSISPRSAPGHTGLATEIVLSMNIYYAVEPLYNEALGMMNIFLPKV